MIAVAGATGFVGRRLVERLRADGDDVRELSRQGDEPVDVLEPASLGPALEDAKLAYYLVHAVGDPGAFDETEADGARNFAAAAAEQRVQRIVYLGGLAHGDDLSDHMRSRQEVGRLLGETGVEVVELRASIVIGDGSLSWQLVTDLVDASPVLALPDSVESRTQPIAIDDVVEYLVRARDVEPGIYEIGGADVLTYRELLAAYADESGRGTITVTVPAVASRAHRSAPGEGAGIGASAREPALRLDRAEHRRRGVRNRPDGRARGDPPILRHRVTSPAGHRIVQRKQLSQTLVCSAPVQPQGPTFSLAGAGSVLIGFTAACVVVGTVIGWAAGNLGYGLAFGSVVGIPVGVAATVIKYRNV